MPISIDGSDISGVTIDGQDVTEVTIDGDVVWSAAGITVSATIPSATATFTLYEDTTGDGVADNQQTYTLSDGVNDLDTGPFSLTSGNSMFYNLEGDNSTTTAGATIDYIEVQY